MHPTASLEALARDRAADLLTEYARLGRLAGPSAEEARTLLLVTAAQVRTDAEMLELVTQCWARGDNRERQALLRALPHLPSPEQYVSLAVDACRSSVQTVFEAIACENPFPARHFPEPSFNQMVLKALFTGVALERIEGLKERLKPELTRMAKGYASERRAAGRGLPPDIGTLTGGQT